MSLVPATEPNVRLADLSPEYSEIMVLGKVLQASGYFRDVRDQAQAVTKILFGRELGISPINSMSSIHIIEGKPALSSNLLAALIKRSGRYDYRVKVWTDTECVLTFRQKVDGKWEEVGESSFTIEDAKRAKVQFKSSNGYDTSWSKFPKAMLMARALSQGERAYCPDVSVCALYVPEELGADVNENNEVIGATSTTSYSTKTFDVQRTTEPIPVPRNPVIEAAQEASGKGTEKVADKPQEGPVTVASAPPMRQPGEDDEDPGTFVDEPIDLPRQRALHRAFSDAIRNPEAKKGADNIFRDWLKHEGFIGDDGKGSTKKVPMYLFDEVKKRASAYAASLPA